MKRPCLIGDRNSGGEDRAAPFFVLDFFSVRKREEFFMPDNFLPVRGAAEAAGRARFLMGLIIRAAGGAGHQTEPGRSLGRA